jgi:hypothetical protein
MNSEPANVNTVPLHELSACQINLLDPYRWNRFGCGTTQDIYNVFKRDDPERDINDVSESATNIELVDRMLFFYLYFV